MTLNKAIIYILAFFTLAGCSNDDGMIIEDKGYQLVFIHTPAEQVAAIPNYFGHEGSEPADLMVSVGVFGDNDSLSVLPGIKDMEDQILEYLNPDGTEYNGIIPIQVIYATEECKSINIALYDKNGELISDITDKARFSYFNPYHPGVVIDQYYLMFDSNRKLLGHIKFGTTIAEYLSYKPLVFTQAHFIFDGINRESFEDGNYVTVKIELGNGRTLTTSTADRRFSSDSQ